MSRSCSLSDSMFVHRVSTIVSTWYSFTLLTRGPRLEKQTHPQLPTRTWEKGIQRRNESDKRVLTIWRPSSELPRSCLPTVWGSFSPPVNHFNTSSIGPETKALTASSPLRTDLPLAVVVQFDRIFLKLRHQVVRGHKPETRTHKFNNSFPDETFHFGSDENSWN